MIRRVDRMENAIGAIVSKIDTVLYKLETLERDKVKKKQNMNKIIRAFKDDKDIGMLTIYYFI